MAAGRLSEPAHRLLRDGTRDAHEATEASGGMRRLMDGELDEAGYDALLRAQLALFAAWEAERSAWLETTARDAGWGYVSRAGLLHADLTALAKPTADVLPVAGFRSTGKAAITGAATARPAGTDAALAAASGAKTLAAPDAARFWGELYVIEGSALGGRLIVRRLRELYPQREHRFYAIGEEAPSAWRRFQQILDTQLHDDALQGAAILGAQHMFARFRQTLSEPAVHV